MRSMFGGGSNYPPGCSGPPEGDDLTALQEAVLTLLEDAGIDTRTNDQIMALIEAGEAAQEAAGIEQAALLRLLPQE